MSGCYPALFCLLGRIPNPQDQHCVLAAHFAKCSINNPAFYARIEYKNFRTTIKRAEIFADAEKAITPQYKRLKCSCITTFQSTLPVGGATAKIHKFPAASLAKVSIFSDTTPEKPYQTGSTAEILCTDSRKSRANLPGIGCTLELRTTKSEYPPADRCSCSRNAQPSFRIDSPDNRSGGCPFPGP